MTANFGRRVSIARVKAAVDAVQAALMAAQTAATVAMMLGRSARSRGLRTMCDAKSSGSPAQCGDAPDDFQDVFL